MADTSQDPRLFGPAGLFLEHTCRKRVIFVISASLSTDKRNMNAYQRVAMLDASSTLSILAPRACRFSGCTSNRTLVIKPLFPGKLGVVVHALFLLLFVGSKPDIVITEPSVLGVCGFLFRRLGAVKWVVDIWDIPIRGARASSPRGLWLSILRRAIRVLYRSADLFLVSIAPGVELKWFQLDSRKVACFSNAIDLSLAQRNRSPGYYALPRRILCTRSTHGPEMGLDTLCQAFQILRAAGHKVSLTVVGAIPPEVEPQVAATRKLHDALFTGVVPHRQLMEMLREAWVCVVPFKKVPDLAQTYPIKVLEYLSLGKVVVASSILGIQSLIQDRVNGMLFEPGDPHALAATLEQLLADEMLHRRLSCAAGNLDQRYDAQAKNGQIAALLFREGPLRGASATATPTSLMLP